MILELFSKLNDSMILRHKGEEAEWVEVHMHHIGPKAAVMSFAKFSVGGKLLC